MSHLRLEARIAVVTEALRGQGFDGALALIREEGVSAEVAIGPGTDIPTGEPAELTSAGRSVERFGLTVCGVTAPRAWPLGSSSLPRAIDAAAALGGGFVRVFAPDFVRSRSAPDQLRQVRRDLSALVERCARRRVAILVETAQGTVVPSPELARYVLDPLGEGLAGVVYDPANMTVEGYLQPAYAVSLLGPLLRHVHAKNCVPVRRDGGWVTRQTALDRGWVDWRAVGSALASHRYSGFVSIDHLSGRASRERLSGDVATLRQLLASGRANGSRERQPPSRATA